MDQTFVKINLNSIVEWMRVGEWTKNIDYGEGSASNPGFPKMPKWFKDNRDWHKIFNKLSDIGLSGKQIKIQGGENWFNFFKEQIHLSKL